MTPDKVLPADLELSFDIRFGSALPSRAWLRIDDMQHASTVFKDWVKHSFAPALRDLGFTGSGQSFAWPNPECWLLLGLQKSTSSSSDEVVFTINLSAANKLLWNELRQWQYHWLTVKPSANSKSPGQEVTRLGLVLPARQDIWWRLRADSTAADHEALGQEIILAVRVHGLPELHRLAAKHRDTRVRRQIDAIGRSRPRPADR